MSWLASSAATPLMNQAVLEFIIRIIPPIIEFMSPIVPPGARTHAFTHLLRHHLAHHAAVEDDLVAGCGPEVGFRQRVGRQGERPVGRALPQWSAVVDKIDELVFQPFIEPIRDRSSAAGHRPSCR